MSTMQQSRNGVLTLVLAMLVILNVSAIKYKGTRVARVELESELHFTLSLHLNNKADLDQLIEDLYDPKSPQYGKYLTSPQFIDRYSPTVDQITAVQDHLTKSSLTVTTVDDNRILVHGKGKVKHLNAAFQTEINYYLDDDVFFFQPETEPVIPSGLSVLGIHGLHNRTKLHHYHKLHSRYPYNSKRDLTQEGFLTPQQIHTAYSLGSTFTGSGQVGALVEFDTYVASDITTYCSTFGLTAVPLENVLISVNGEAAPTTPTSQGGQTEVTLDIQLFNALAPGLQQLLVYIAPNVGGATLSMYSKISNDNLATVVSTSWGIAESSLGSQGVSSEAVFYQKMAAQGQSLFAAAGDAGAYESGGDTTLSVDDPASQPLVTGVGGTSLTLNAQGEYSTETTWLTSKSSSGTEGGGGGVSGFNALPSYQLGVISAASLGSTSFRNVPDVSLEADPQAGYSVIVTFSGESTETILVGGTSCAAPLWASFMTLVNQARIANGLPIVGFFNTLLYTTAQGSNYNSLFHDINDGSNNGFYPAVTGYDDATGWGSFKGDALLAALSAPPTNAPVVPATKTPSTTPTNAPVATNGPPTKAPTTTNAPGVAFTGAPTSAVTQAPSQVLATGNGTQGNNDSNGPLLSTPVLLGLGLGSTFLVAGMFSAMAVVIFTRTHGKKKSAASPARTQLQVPNEFLMSTMNPRFQQEV